jgi:hypothetical protein
MEVKPDSALDAPADIKPDRVVRRHDDEHEHLGVMSRQWTSAGKLTKKRSHDEPMGEQSL